MEKLQAWIKNNTFTVQGQKYFDNAEFIKEVQKVEKIKSEQAAIKRASYLLLNVLDIKNVKPLKKGRGSKVKQIGEAFDNNKSFKDAYIEKHGNTKIVDLTNDQLNTEIGRISKITKDAGLVPKDGITLKEFAKRSGLGEANIKSLRGIKKDSARGKEFNKLFKFTVIPNKATYVSGTGLEDKIKQYKSGLENIKKYGQSGSIEEVGDHAEELKYLIKETRKDLDAIDKYGLIQQSKQATKHAEGGIVGLKNGGLLEKYEEYAPKGPWTRGLTDMEITYELYNLLAPYMSLFMKEGGRVGFKEGKGMTRRAFLKLLGGAAALPIVGKYFKLAKPAAKVMDDIKITLRGDGDWERDIDGLLSGGNWVNYSFEALTDKGKEILTKLTKGKNASLVDQGDGVYFPGKQLKDKTGFLIDEAESAVDAVDSIKKAKGKISLNTRVGKNTKGIDKSQKKYPGESTDSTEHFKTYSSKNINKKNILDEADDYWVGDYGGYKNKGFYDENVEEIIDIITKKAEGGRVGLYKGGIIDLLIKGGKFLNKYSPLQAYTKYLKSVKDRTLKANETGKFTDLPLETIPIGAGGALITNVINKKLKGMNEEIVQKNKDEIFDEISTNLKEEYKDDQETLEKLLIQLHDNVYMEEKAEGGRIGLDTGGPPIEPYSTSDPKAAAKEMARRYIDMTVEPAKIPIDEDIQLMFDLDRATIGGTKDFLGGEIDFGINKGFGNDDLQYGFNWNKKFSDGGSVLQRPMFYQGGLTKTVPPQRGPMPQGLQSDVYDGIMRPGVINGRN